MLNAHQMWETLKILFNVLRYVKENVKELTNNFYIDYMLK